jgi:hypothetical protein
VGSVFACSPLYSVKSNFDLRNIAFNLFVKDYVSPDVADEGELSVNDSVHHTH